MIDPGHRCYWVRRQRTELQLDGERLVGAGASLRVWLAAVGRNTDPWYSIRYGDGGDQVLAVRLSPEGRLLARDDDTSSHPLRECAGDLVSIEERSLPSDALSAFGIDLDSPEKALSRGYVTEVLTAHDDCFVTLAPTAVARRDDVLRAVLRLQEFYLGREVDWDPVRADLLGLLTEGRIRLQAQPARKALLVTLRSESILARLLRREPRLLIDVRSGTAVIRHRSR